MKKETLIIAVILLMWVPVLYSYVNLSDFLDFFTELLFLLVLCGSATYATFKYLESKLFSPIHGRYWIQKGAHYSDGLFWTSVRNVKFLVFKREIEFWYRLDKRAIQDDAYQKNKIFGITSIFYRHNSIRMAFASRRSLGTFDAYQYVYANKTNYQLIEEINRKPGQWYHAKLKAPKTIWFGMYHFPYHGGKKPSDKKYYIDIRFDEPS